MGSEGEGDGAGLTMMGKGYDVQRLTEQVFVVRERLSADGEPGRDDHIVRSLAFGEEAYRYANQVNERQRDLDKHHGHWAQHAIQEKQSSDMGPGDLEQSHCKRYLKPPATVMCSKMS